MKPISFPQQTIVMAKDQPEYIPLPVHRTPDGQVTSRWSLSLWERVRILFGANIFWTQLTFNFPLQPIRASLDFEEEQ